MMKKKETKALALSLILMLVIGVFAACTSSDSGDEDYTVDTDMTKIAEFTTVDIEGNEVTQDIFADADITMINYWGTYCMPCINEMPEIAAISEEYEGRAQVIGVPIDVSFSQPDSENYKDMLKILDEADAHFTNIDLAGDILEFAKAIPGVPTTIFVDKEGNIVGDPVIGAHTDEYRRALDDYLAQE